METSNETFEGGCTCGYIRYRLISKPLIVHCCHCSWCQRETGSAFVINVVIETDRLQLLNGEAVIINTPSNSGKGQKIARCPKCQIAIWSHYAGMGKKIAFVRAGTLDKPDQMPPDVHIYTKSKLPWINLPDGTPAFYRYYKPNDYWSEESLKRREALRSKAKK